jgi:hypothetical protein
MTKYRISLERRIEIEEELIDLSVKRLEAELELVMAYETIDYKALKQVKKQALDLLVKINKLKEEIENEGK